jgi:hypothetical protein
MKNRNRKGQVSGLVMDVIIVVVLLFIGLFMITQVSGITAINNTSAFYTTYTNLITNTGTIYQVLILVVIVIALGVAIMFLRGFTGMAGGAPTGVPATI